MKKLLSIVLPNLGGGGAERVTLNLVETFMSMGYDVDLALLDASGELMGDIPAGATVTNLRVSRIRAAYGPLRRYCRHRRPTAVLAAMWPLTAVAVAAVRSLGAKRPRIVVAEHVDFLGGGGADSAAKRTLRWFGNAVYRRADSVVAVSDGARDALAALSRFPATAIRTIYNPCRAPEYVGDIVDRDLAEWWSSGAVRLLNIGRLMKQKDQALLVDAMAIVRTRLDARLLILGEGPERSAIERKIADYELEDVIALPGFRHDPHAYLRGADCFVLSSLWEGLPTVIIEALMQGTPIVSTDCPSGPRELLEGGRLGRLVQIGDARALADAIVETVRSPSDPEVLRQSAARFEPEKAAHAYLELLDPAGRPA